MGLETGNRIEDLVITNPVGTDGLSESDDHHRLIKTCVQGSFPNLGASAVTVTADEINDVVGAGGGVTGEIKAFAGASIPNGFLLCDGASYTVASEGNLHAVIGDTYGGDGGTNFNVPDLRGRVGLGLDNMGGTAADRVNVEDATALGNSGGDQNMQQHDHPIGIDSGTGPNVTLGAQERAGPIGTDSEPIADTGTGGSQNLQPWLGMNYIIKT